MSNINYDKFGTYLRKTLSSLNVALNMLDINAVINEKNPVKIDFYDRNNSLLYSEDFSSKLDKLNYIISIDDFRTARDIYHVEFTDNYGQRVTCSNCIENESAAYYCGVKKDQNYGMNIVMKINGKGIYYLRMYELDQNEFYYIKTFGIDENGTIECNLISKDSPNANIKEVFATSPLYSSSPTLSMHGRDNDKEKFINCNEAGLSTVRDDFEKNIEYSFSKDTYRKELDNLLCHPWNKRVLEFTIDEFEKKIPGFKDFLAYNFSLYNHIVNTEYDPNTESGGIVDSNIGAIEAIPKNVNGIQLVKKDANH